MSTLLSSTGVNTTPVTFDTMLENGFGVVTVMNARVFKEPIEDILGVTDLSKLKVHNIVKGLRDETDYVKLDTLKIANINQDGPSKTITGGQTGSALLKYGKTATIEIQDALGRADALELLGGATIETFTAAATKGTGTNADIAAGNTKVIHFGDQFGGPKPILGESFFIDQKSGKQIKVYILIYEMLPDSIFNLTQDAEGDATVFDMNGSLNSKEICIGTDGTANTTDTTMNVFYSILPQIEYTAATTVLDPVPDENGGQAGSGGQGGNPGGEGGAAGKDPVEGEGDQAGKDPAGGEAGGQTPSENH